MGGDEGAVSTAEGVGGSSAESTGAARGASAVVPALADTSVGFSGSGARGGLCFIKKTASVWGARSQLNPVTSLAPVLRLYGNLVSYCQ